MRKLSLNLLALPAFAAVCPVILAVEPITDESGVTGPDDPYLQVIGGRDADIGEYPWMGALVSTSSGGNTRQFCGCTAIDPYWVMTAAHCLERDLGIEEFKIVFGTSDLGAMDAGQVFYPKSVVFHPNYAAIYDSNDDIALVQLSQPLPESFQLVSLISSTDFEQAGRTARALGWGLTGFDTRNPTDTLLLQQVDLPIVTREFANQDIYHRGRVSETMLSAGEFGPYRSVHSGDSGGPLLMYNSDTNGWEQIGISSYGAGCNKENNPISIFTKVSHYKDWIDDIVQNDFLHWLRENGLDRLDHDDGDPHAPLVEWMFGMDPNKTDHLNWETSLKQDDLTPGHSILLPLKMKSALPLFDLKIEWSEDLFRWYDGQFNWDNLIIENIPDSEFSIYNVPVVSESDPTRFYRTYLNASSGIAHGLIPLRIGSNAKGYLGRAYQGRGLQPFGPTRFDYLLELFDSNKKIGVRVESPEPHPFKLKIFDLNDRKVLVDTERRGDFIFWDFMPEENKSYVLRVESILWGTPVPFKIYVDYLLNDGGLSEEIVSSGSLTPDDTPYKRPGHYSDRYQYSLNGFQTYKIELRSDTLDPILIIKNSSSNELLQELDEEPPGIAEEFIIYTWPNSQPDIIVGSWRFGETGDYELELSPYTEKTSAGIGDNALGIIHPEDRSDEQNGTTFYLDFIRLENINSPEGVTIGVWSVDGFTPTYAIYNVTDRETVHQVTSKCEDAWYYFKPETEKAYDLVIIAREKDLGDNYRFAIREGRVANSGNPNDDPENQATRRPHMNQFPVSGVDLNKFYLKKSPISYNNKPSH